MRPEGGSCFIMKLSALIKPGRNTDGSSWPSDLPAMSDREKEAGPYDDAPVPLLTWRSLLMGAFVSIGGMIFGYDTGQISGFLEMRNFLRRYGQRQPDGSYRFSHVRSGLIVALVRVNPLPSSRKPCC